MTGAIFLETLRHKWRHILYWGVGLGLMGWMQAAIIPDTDALQQVADLMESMPPFLLQAFGATDIEFMATPEGYMALQFFSFILIVYAFYAVTAGLNVTANEEEKGILDVVMSLPIPRWRLVLERVLAYTVIIAGIVFLSFVGLWVAVATTPALTMSVARLAESSVNMMPGILVTMAFTVMAATLLRRRSHALAAAAIFFIASYFVDVLGRAASDTIFGTLRWLSFYTYYDSTAVMKNGLIWVNFLLLTAVAIVMVLVAIWGFQRRDIGL